MDVVIIFCGFIHTLGIYISTHVRTCELLSVTANDRLRTSTPHTRTNGQLLYDIMRVFDYYAVGIRLFLEVWTTVYDL